MKVLTLDEMVSSGAIVAIDFIKCDVEGGELDVLKGSTAILDEFRPGWVMEVSKKTNNEVFEFLRGLGYSAFAYDSQLAETETYRDREFSNYFFFHPKSSIWDRARVLL